MSTSNLSTASERASLEEAAKGIQTAIEKYQVLHKLSKLYIHFKHVNPVDVRLNEAACFVALASIKRLLAEATPPQTGKHLAYVAEAEHHLNSAKNIYNDLAFHAPSQLDTKRGMATILQEVGSLRYFQDKHADAQSVWAEACGMYEDIGDAPAVASLRKKMDALRLAHDIQAYKKTLLERKGENRERDAIFKAFQKFDKDNSGSHMPSRFWSRWES
ncbi:hypothetical protein, variant [Aphanomyces invadans]|uniref:EF-hand domain-containing protein n=1 Tax=Aphanomyces invadans TaxID=157072 RepID=A0A024TLQ4_9STRA|nr:hypothetical protein, variant [Aphanomyces invadans]ETV94282.1 hypothetical protein, variant [Aphanomyces invadans]|eukprot:XP_008877043.1 hypothetical protein, variant [Aphanomyces invadans]